MTLEREVDRKSHSSEQLTIIDRLTKVAAAELSVAAPMPSITSGGGRAKLRGGDRNSRMIQLITRHTRYIYYLGWVR